MMSGVTSPARPWFRLTTNDPDFAEFGPVKEWLFKVEREMSSVYLRSNLYNVLPICYGDIGGFGTHAMAIEEDFDETVRFYPFAVGSYCLANDHRLRVTVIHRELRMTVRQLVEKFGQVKNGKPDWSVFSSHVRNAWDNSRYEQWVDVCHVVMPNQNYRPGAINKKFKKFASIYYEKGSGSGTGNGYFANGDEDKVLRESGYDFFPVLAPRWEITGEDVYGTDWPILTALGDIKQLQLGERRSSQAIEKMINPPMVGPMSLMKSRASLGPGDITYLSSAASGDQFRPAHETNLRIDFLEQKQQQIRNRIQRVTFEDLFLMLANEERRDITATEITERKEEKLLALGPVLEQLNQDLLDPLIDNTFSIMVRQGKIPTPPKELQGEPLKVEYISILAQAQKLVGIGALERFSGYVSQLAGVDPSVLKKVNFNNMVDAYAEMTSIQPDILRSQDEVEAMAKAEAQVAAQQRQIEQTQVAAGAAKELSQTKLSGDSALDALLEQANAGALA
jgi:hypothetical protein